MNLAERNSRHQAPPPPHRRKTPSFSSSLLDSVLRSIDESNDGGLHEQNLRQQQQRFHGHDNDPVLFSSEPKRCNKTRLQTPELMAGEEQIPSLRRAIMIDQWMETHNNKSGYASRKSSRKFSSDSSSSGTTSFATSSETETPSTHRSLPNSFTISRKTVESSFFDDDQKANSKIKFMKSTKLKAMKIYGDLKKAKQPISPGNRISAFLNSIFASSSSSKKVKIEEARHIFGSLKKSRSIKQDPTATCSSFSRSCLSKKPRSSNVKRSVRFYSEDNTVILDRKSVHDRDPSLMPLPKYERKRFTEKNYTNSCRKILVNVDVEDDDDEDDLFELEIVGGVGIGAYREELPVFETTDLRKIRI